jgi:CMP-N-acetylneuraminate monooxygenase
MRLFPRGMFETYADDDTFCSARIADTPGVHANDDIFYKLGDGGQVVWVVSRTCDHAGGKLRLDKENKTATCPMHGWRLSLDTLSYENVQVCKQVLEFKQVGKILEYRLPKIHLRFPKNLNLGRPVNVAIRFLAHACVEIRIGGVSIITDPWLVGPCFTTGWWHSVSPPDDALDILAGADMVYISHNHPDHMHGETLRCLDRNKPMVVPDFESGSVTSMLRGWGFRDVRPLDFGHIFEVEQSGVYLSLLRAGDFRDDSGLVVAHGDFTAVLTVDSNRLNQLALPVRPSILLTSFAGGATGYPLCFERYGQEEKDAVIARNRNAILSVVDEYVSVCDPLAYMPYAGYFMEYAARDSYIRTHNRKNSAADAIAYVTRKHEDLLGIDPTVTDQIFWRDGAFETSASHRAPLAEVNTAFADHWMSRIDVPRAAYDAGVVSRYFAGSGFRDSLILYLVPTDDDFCPIQDAEGFIIDFRKGPSVIPCASAGDVDEQYVQDAPDSSAELRRMRIRIRIGSLMRLAADGLPWEDALIGFQCRMHRTPDIYNSRFWFHFTNSYIGEKALSRRVISS